MVGRDWETRGLIPMSPAFEYEAFVLCLQGGDRLDGLVVKASASRAEDPGFDFRLSCGNFSGSSPISDLKIGIHVATLPGAWR